MAVQLCHAYVAQRFNSGKDRCQTADALFAFGAADVVLPASQVVVNHGIRNQQADVALQRQRSVIERAAVEHDGVACLGMAGNKLVHNSATGAYVIVLCLLAELG